jgi:hypothetical protein
MRSKYHAPPAASAFIDGRDRPTQHRKRSEVSTVDRSAGSGFRPCQARRRAPFSFAVLISLYTGKGTGLLGTYAANVICGCHGPKLQASRATDPKIGLTMVISKAVRFLTFARSVRLRLYSSWISFRFRDYDSVTHYDADKVKLIANSWDIRGLIIKHRWRS